MTGDKSHKGVSSLCSNLFRYWLLRYLSELSKRQRIDGDYLPPFAAKLKNKGQLLRKGWGTRLPSRPMTRSYQGSYSLLNSWQERVFDHTTLLKYYDRGRVKW
jgi:hypothetical protein